MLRVALAMVVMLLGMLAGCRSVAPTSLAHHYSGSATTAGMPSALANSPPADLHPAVFVQEADTVDEPGGPAERTELLPSAVPPQRQHGPRSLGDLECIAFQNHPALAAAAARLEAARGRHVQAGLYPNPVIGYHATEIGNLDSAGQQGAFVNQRVMTGGKLRLDQAIAGKEIDEAHFRFHAQEQRVLNDVRVRFYRALVVQRRLDLTEELAGIGDDLVTATQKLLAGGLGTENDLLQADIRAEDAHILLDNARNENVEAWRRLAAVTGVPTMPVTPLAGELDGNVMPIDWDESYGLVLGNNPQLEAARTRAERASIAVARARREPIPNIDFSLSVRHHNVTRDDVANVQIGMPIPIFNKNQGNIRSAEADWMMASNDVRRIELDLQDRLAVAYRRYANARHQADRYRERMLPKAKKSLELVTRGYEKGQVKYLTLLTAQQTHLQIHLAYLDSLQELWSASTVIQGQLLTGSLGRATEDSRN